MFYDSFTAQCAKKGVTPNRACTDCGISRTAVAKWKNGSTPNGTTLSRLADYFGVTTDLLLGTVSRPDEEGTKKAPLPKEGRITPDDFTYAMQNECANLTDMDKQILLSMAKQLNDARKQRNEGSQ